MIELPPDDAGMETAELFGIVVAEPPASSLPLPAAVEDDGVLGACERQVWPNICRNFELVNCK